MFMNVINPVNIFGILSFKSIESLTVLLGSQIFPQIGEGAFNYISCSLQMIISFHKWKEHCQSD